MFFLVFVLFYFVLFCFTVCSFALNGLNNIREIDSLCQLNEIAYFSIDRIDYEISQFTFDCISNTNSGNNTGDVCFKSNTTWPNIFELYGIDGEIDLDINRSLIDSIPDSHSCYTSWTNDGRCDGYFCCVPFSDVFVTAVTLMCL